MRTNGPSPNNHSPQARLPHRPLPLRLPPPPHRKPRCESACRHREDLLYPPHSIPSRSPPCFLRILHCTAVALPIQFRHSPLNLSESPPDFMPGWSRGGWRRAEQGSTAGMWSVAPCCPRCLDNKIIDTRRILKRLGHRSTCKAPPTSTHWNPTEGASLFIALTSLQDAEK